MTSVFEIYHLFQKLLIFTIELLHDIVVIEWYYEKATLIFVIKVPQINCQGYHVLEMMGAEPKSSKFYKKWYPSQIFFK